MATIRATVRTYANPYFLCAECHQWITGHTEHSSARWANVPCGHAADSYTVCRTWGPIDGCQCPAPSLTVNPAQPRPLSSGKPEDPGNFFEWRPCVDCGRWVLYRAFQPIDARCETCWKTFVGMTT